MRKFSDCAISKNKLSFKMPDDITNALLNDELVLFAGAGISTESDIIFKETIYDDIKSELDIDKSIDISFPELMSKFCDSTTNGRQKLLEKIKQRFDYCHQFNELYRAASRFHSEIAPIWMLKNIITTNWDDYFERNCDAIPIVTPEDFVFYKIDQRKVFKIHGSISNYGSVIATTNDYEKCYNNLNTGLIGATLKTMLATKTLIFVGYSFRDYDFMKILNFIKEEMKDVLPHIYIVTLDEFINKRIDGIKHTIVKTDGRYFFTRLRQILEDRKIIIPQENIERIYHVEYLRSEMHKLVSEDFIKNRISTLIYCLFYQDGIQHAIDCLKHKEKSGETYNPHYLINMFRSYFESMRKDLSKAKNYADLAYVDGYIKGITIPLHEEFEPEEFPLFYIYGKGSVNDVKLFKDTVNNNKVYHKTAEKYGKQFFKELLKKDNELIAHHRPFI